MIGRLSTGLTTVIRGLVDDIVYTHGVDEFDAKMMLAAALSDQRLKNRIISWPEGAALKGEEVDDVRA